MRGMKRNPNRSNTAKISSVSGRSGGSRLPSPLRTVRDTFASYRSGPSSVVKGVMTVVAVGMDEREIANVIFAS